MRDKRGLSTIVVTLIIILISLVSVAIVWAVVSNLLKTGTEGTDINFKCLNAVVEATKVNCSTTSGIKYCDVQFMRSGTGNDAIDGVKLVFRNSTAGTNSGLITITGNIEALVGKKQTGINTTLGNVNRLEVTIFFKNSAGNDQSCSQTSPFTNIVSV